MNLTPMNFDSIDLQEVPVTICGKAYALRQASSKVGELYRSKSAECAKARMADGEMTGMDIQGVGAVQPYLVSLMLFEIDSQGFRVPVPIATINCWDDSIIKALYERCKEISPSLVETPTKEALLKQKASVEKQLAKMAGPSAEDQAKN